LKQNRSGEDGGIQYIDNSLIYSKDEVAIVTDIIFREIGDIPFVTVKLQSYRMVDAGDKFANR
jgi:DNA-directed RNA polymerase beta subunit